MILRLREKASSSEKFSGKIPAVVGGRNPSFNFSREFANRVADYPIAVYGVKMVREIHQDVIIHFEQERKVLLLRIVAGLLLVTWIILVLIGKGGFVHLFFLCFLGVAAVEVMTVVRGKIIR